MIRFRFIFSSHWSLICSHAMTSIFVVLYVMSHAHFGLPVGFRFGMYRGEHVDILYGNVKHAFFQVKLLTSSLCLFIDLLIIRVGTCFETKLSRIRGSNVNLHMNRTYCSAND